MLNTFTAILTAHLLGDFVFQSDKILKNKTKIGVLLFHVFIITILTVIFMGKIHWSIIGIIFVTHLVMDAIKIHFMKDTLTSFLVDQCFHVIVIICLAYLFNDIVINGWWSALWPPNILLWYLTCMTFLSGVILITRVGSIIIGKFMEQFDDEMENNGIDGLKKGGQYIGQLERFLVLLLIMMNQPTAIGFLIAAKSILRFGEIKDSKDRKVAEYIIIGTFLSFGWALMIAVITNQGVWYWLSMS